MARKEDEEKAWLRRYRDAKRELRRLEGERRELTEVQKPDTGSDGTERPGENREPGESQTTTALATMYKDKISAARQRAEEIFIETTLAIDRLEISGEREVLSRRYLQLDGCEFAAWDKIAAELGYQLNTLYKLHREALRKLRT